MDEVRTTRSCGKRKEETSHDNTCSICLNDLSFGDRDISVLPCGHTFHSVCIMTNVISSGNLRCPLCRGSITVEKEEEDEEEESDAESESSTEEHIESVAARLLRKLSREDAISLLRNKFKVPKRLEARTTESLFEMLAEQIICETDDEEERED